MPWFALPRETVLRRLKARESGLTDEEAEERLRRHGPNALELADPISPWEILRDQLKSLVVVLLFAAAGLAFVIGDLLEALAILSVLVINTAVGFWTEWRARLAMDALRRLQVQEAVVLRSGRERRVDARRLVPGDIIMLEAGASIPADARVLAAAELRINEAPLTGESLPVDKDAAAIISENGEVVPLAERTAMVYKGTHVTAGAGHAVVVATGAATEIGHVSRLVQKTESGETPLERRLEALGRRLVWLTLGVATLVTVLGVLRGADLLLMLETGIALAIAAVPEGLPVVATITLAVGVRRMARRQALVRRLPAVETLGSATVICTDKTGTLTAGEMTMTALALGDVVIEISGAGYEPAGEFRLDGAVVEPGEIAGAELALRIGTLVNHASLTRAGDGWEIVGDPTEAALLVAAAKVGLERDSLRRDYRLLAEVPFSSERKMMATFHRSPVGETVAYLKGAPKQIVELSRRQLTRGGLLEIGDANRQQLFAINRSLARRGLRVLALAYRELDGGEQPSAESLRDLTFVGFVGILDPPALGVKETIARLHKAGVRTVMITGDQTVTAQAVARDLGLFGNGDETIGGSELVGLSDEQLAGRVANVAAFSRVTPDDKLRIIHAFQRCGHIVGMLGDGVNDAAALKRADIGVAMGLRGTEVAKETADVVLEDDRFETIGAAVEDGRVIFDNIRKSIFYLFSCNLSEVLTLLLAGLAGMPLPLLPLQILWLNLITDVFPALALALEPADADVMRRPPRDPDSTIMSGQFVLGVVAYSLLITVATLGIFYWGYMVRQVDKDHAITLAFMTLALAQLFHVLNARSSEPVLLTRRLWQNGWILAALALTVSLQLAAVYNPLLSRVLHTHALELADWAAVLAASALPLALGQLFKLVAIPDTGEAATVPA